MLYTYCTLLVHPAHLWFQWLHHMAGKLHHQPQPCSGQVHILHRMFQSHHILAYKLQTHSTMKQGMEKEGLVVATSSLEIFICDLLLFCKINQKILGSIHIGCEVQIQTKGNYCCLHPVWIGPKKFHFTSCAEAPTLKHDAESTVIVQTLC